MCKLLRRHTIPTRNIQSLSGACHDIVNFSGQGFCVQAGSFKWQIQTLINTVQVMSACDTRFQGGTPF